MKWLVGLIFCCLAALTPLSAQTLDYRYLSSDKLEVYAWYSGVLPTKIATTSQIAIIPLGDPSTLSAPTIESCTYNRCILILAKDFDPSKEYILIIDYFDKDGKKQRVWGNIKTSATITASKDVDKLRKEILITSKVPLAVPQRPITLARSEVKISANSYLATKETTKVETTKVDSIDPNGQGNTELTVKLSHRFNEGGTTSLSVPLTTYNGIAGGIIQAEGSIDVPGLPAPPENPAIQISLSNIAAVHQKPVMDFSGTAGFRSAKFAGLSGRYLDTTEAGCIDKTGRKRDRCRENIKPANYFAGFKPTVDFDIGFNSTKSKNAIVVNLPLVYYFNLTNRRILDTDIETAAAANPGSIPLRVYGGWANTPFFRLADVKTSFGPKIEFYRQYYPRNLIFSIRGDFEFHRWLGTITGRRKLLAADLNPSASKDGDKKLFGKLTGIDFGWKLVPYIAFDGGAKVASDDKVEKTIAGVKQSVNIPRYSIARFSTGAVGSYEWLINHRSITLSLEESVIYLATTEINSYSTSTLLLLRRIRGVQPYFKTSLSFSLDPGKRYSLRTTWENGRALPSLEYLNKVSTGISIVY